LSEKLSSLGAEVLCEVEATSILMDGGRAVGILAQDSLYDYTIHAGAVVLATGGFASGSDLLLRETEGSFSKAQMDLAGGSSGDGLLMALGVGAQVEGLEEVDLVPGVLKEKGFVIPELWRLFDSGALLFNSGGRRFCDETAGDEEVARALLSQDGYFAYLVFDQEMAGAWPYLSYIPASLRREASSIEDLCDELGLAEYAKENLVNGVYAWNQEAGSASPSLSREKGLGPGLLSAPFYGAKISAGIIRTMGGVCIDEEARVLGPDGEAFLGLFAAGEVCGGIHGKQIFEGNPLLDAVTFGRTAGRSAARLSLEKEEAQ
ncbi:MAG: FAD-binding protein, partial [Blautia sp.]|nr:FAD-binding protein [Blautia sp.]